MRYFAFLLLVVGGVVAVFSSSDKIEQLDASRIEWKPKETWSPPIVDNVGHGCIGNNPMARNFGWIPPDSLENSD